MSVVPSLVFFAYSHQDARLQVQLRTHMAGLVRQNLIRPWHDGEIGAGDDWRQSITEHLSFADLILLLISSDFAASDWCCSEMERALDRQAAGMADVVPVLLRPVEWPDAPFRHLNLLPENGRPVSLWRNRDDAFVSIVKGVRERLVDRPFHNLPPPSAPFVGRARELRELEELLLRPEVRLVGLHGPRGAGKTRLAEQAAAKLFPRFQNGVCFVPFGRIGDPAVVPSAIHHALGLKEAEGVSIQEGLRHHLESRRMLLLLDGFEAAGAAAAFLPRLLEECPHLKILTTGRQPLRARGARNVALSLSLAPDDAVHLFLQSARAAAGELPGTGQAAAICERFRHVALAVEVVGARAGEMTAADAADAADGGEEWRAGDAAGAALAWSYRRLSAEERRLFRRLSVFHGGCTAHSAAAVCGDREGWSRDAGELLRSLMDKRLLCAAGGNGGTPNEVRYRMLDVIREFAAGQLGAAEGLALHRRHAACFLALAEEAEPHLMSPGRGPWMRRLESERANLRSAIAWLRATPEGSEPALRLAGSLFWFWNLRAYFREGRALLAGVLRRSRDGGAMSATPGRAKALYALGGLAFLQGDLGVARHRLQESAALWSALGEARRRAYALVILGMVEQGLGELDTALDHERESVETFRREGDTWGYALALNDLGNVHRARNDREQAIGIYQQSRELWRRMNDGWGLPVTLSNMGFLEMLEGDREAARLAFKEALQIQYWLEDRWGLAETLKYLADLCIRQDHDATAERLYRESLDLNRRIGRKPFMIGCLAGLAVVAERRGAREIAARLAGAVESQRGSDHVMAKPVDHAQYEQAVAALAVDRDEGLARVCDLGARTPLAEITSWALGLPPIAG